MKKVLLLLMGMGLFVSANAQTVYSGYQDGKIWFKIKPHTIQSAYLTPQDPLNLPLSTLDFVARMKEKYQITKLSKPFYAAKNSQTLQLTFQLEFSDYYNVEKIIAELLKNENVEYAEKVPLDHLFLTPNDPMYNASNQWGLFKINAEQAWNLSVGSSSIVVATVDNAIQTNHTDLQAAMWVNTGEVPNNGIDDDGNGYVDDINGYDVADNDNNPNPPSSSWDHGTHVAGTTGCKTNNSTGLASIGFGISIMAVKATANSSSPSSVTDGYAGIVYAAVSGAHVINCSWGGTSSSQTAQNVINYAWSQGCIIVAAAGNNNTSTPHYPAAYNNVVAVASTTTNDTKSSFSNYGTWVDVSAPGSNIASTVPFNNYAYMSGTSMASPLVAGLCGLMWSYNPGLTNTDIINCLTSTTVNINSVNPGYSGLLGTGRINAYAAMQCIGQTLTYPPVANFVANNTVISAGGTVNFTDLSIYNPTSWSWSFSPSAGVVYQNGTNSSSQNPVVQFNNPGTYTVSLTASNAYGSDVETKTSYIQVNPTTGCDTVTNTLPSDNIYIWSFSGNNGYIGGHNNYNITRWAEQITNYSPNTHLQGVIFYFVKAMVNGVGNVTVRVWDDNGPSGAPGTVVATKVIPISEIVPNILPNNSFYPTEVIFDNPVTIPSPGNFYIGYEIAMAPGDTVVCALTQNLYPNRPNSLWHYTTSGGWVPTNTLNSSYAWAMHVYLLATTLPVNANITPVNPTVCQDSTLTLNATTSIGATTYQWYINGSTYTNQSTQSTPAVTFNVPGSHKVYLVAYNSCGFYHYDSTTVTVNPSPVVNVSATNDTICSGQSTTLSASGNASTYVWSNGVPNGPGPHSVSPTTSTTYTVTGVSAQGCSTSSNITIVVENLPVANALYTPSTAICPNTPVVFDATTSVDASTYSWSFTGGTPSSSNTPLTTVTYAAGGTYPYSLVVGNNCGTHTYNGSITIDVCAGVDEQTLTSAFMAYGKENQLILQYHLPFNDEEVVLTLYSVQGEIVYTSKMPSAAGQYYVSIPTDLLADGLYLIQLRGKEVNEVIKWVKHH